MKRAWVDMFFPCGATAVYGANLGGRCRLGADNQSRPANTSSGLASWVL
jgi:hypothetical protein